MIDSIQTLQGVAEAFVEATTVALHELASAEVALAADARTSSAPPSAEIYAALALRHDPPGLLLCGFSAAAAEAFARRTLPAQQLLTTELVDDAIGELANVIAGQAKTLLKGTPAHFQLTTPSTSRGTCPHLSGSVDGIELRFAGDFAFWLWVFLPCHF